MNTYLQFGNAILGQPCLTMGVPCKELAAGKPKLDAQGYGTTYLDIKVLYNSRWRRVCVDCYGNGSGTPYVSIDGEDVRVDIIDDRESSE